MWRPWRRHQAEAVAETARAHAALAESRADVDQVEALALDLERIRKENNLAPRIAEAFRLSPQHRRSG